MHSLKLHIDNKNNFYLINGDINLILNNRRLLFSFERLNIDVKNDCILVPFDDEKEIEVLKEINDLFDKFSISVSLSKQTLGAVESYSNELKNFQEFSNKAVNIKNNEFEQFPELVNEFNTFQKVLDKKLIRTLYPLQLLSAFHLAFSQNGCNFAVPGAGKTSIVYASYAYLKNLKENHPKHVDRIMVIGPLSSFKPWEDEYFGCFGKKVTSQRLSGDTKITRNLKKQHLYSSNPDELTLIFHGGVDALQEEIIDFLKKNKTMLVVDEAHRIKNPEGVWGKSVINIAKEAKSRVVLTGTPAPNGYEDLYNLYQFIYPYKFKDILEFHYGNLMDMTKNSSDEDERVKTFIDNISPYFIRIKKNDLKLPPIKEETIYVNMGEKQREIYDFIESKYIDLFENNSSGTIKDVLNRARLIRLRQASTNPSLLEKTIKSTMEEEDYSSNGILQDLSIDEFKKDSDIFNKIIKYRNTEIPVKFTTILDIIKNKITNKEKFLIWTIFIQNAKELQNFLSINGIKSKLLIGEVEQNERELTIKDFNNPDNYDFQVIIANPFSVAESISLHKGCHNAIYMERDYNCSNFLQSKDRIHRVGLEKNQETNYYYILSKDSIDEVIDERLKSKAKRMENIINKDIPLFFRVDNFDETDLITSLLNNYSKRDNNLSKIKK